MAAITTAQEIRGRYGRPLVTTAEAAEILGCCPRTVAKMCDAGELKAVKVRSVWRINLNALIDFAGIEIEHGGADSA